MRSPLLLLAALGLAACGSSDRRAAAEPGASGSASRGPDQIVLRVPRAGGRLSAYVYPRLDSAVWTSADAAPPLARVLAFDGESGILAAVDAKGIPTRVDLRLGTVKAAVKRPLGEAASADAETIYGVGDDGTVVRLTPTSASWRQKLAAPASDVFPQRDGSLLVASTTDGGTTIWRLRPPGTEVGDSVRLDGAGRALHTPLGDRVYYADGAELFGVRSRDLTPLKRLRLDAPVRDVAPTPSGDRLFVVLEGTRALAVIDRYREAVEGSVPLPGEARELRVDPLGRYVLARAAGGDSAWVVAIGTDKVIGTVATEWRADLPLVLPSGDLALAKDADVWLMNAATLERGQIVAGGARDFWHVVTWNGFRPRAAGLDTPVEFRASDIPIDTGLPVDSLGLPVGGDSIGLPRDSALPAPPSTRTPPSDTGRRGAASAAPRRTFAAAGETTAASFARTTVYAPVALRVQPPSQPSQPPRDSATRVSKPAPAQPAAQPAAKPAAKPPQPARAGRTTESRGEAVSHRARGYTVQFAALETEAQARRVATRMKVDGATPLVVPADRDGETWWRVVLGPFPTRADAERAAKASGAKAPWIYEGAP